MLKCKLEFTDAHISQIAKPSGNNNLQISVNNKYSYNVERYNNNKIYIGFLYLLLFEILRTHNSNRMTGCRTIAWLGSLNLVVNMNDIGMIL